MNRKYWLYSSLGWGMLGTTLLANYLFASGIVNDELLYQSVSVGWNNARNYDYMTVTQIVLIRILETGGIWLMCRSGQPLIYRVVILAMIGMGIGYQIVLFTWSQGIVGLLHLVLCNVPHSIFYGGAWLLFIENRGRQPKILPWILFGVGILLEIYINPLFLGLI